MSDLSYLWRNRKRPGPGASLMKLVAKRVLTLPRLALNSFGASRLRGKGARIGALVAIDRTTFEGPAKNLTVGAFSAIGRATIALHAKVTIGQSVIINEGCQLLTGSHDLRDSAFRLITGEIVVEDYAWICTGAIILPGVRVGRGAVVAAGCVLAKDLPAGAVALGNPAKIHLDRRTPELDYKPSCLHACHEAWIGRDRIAGLPPT